MRNIFALTFTLFFCFSSICAEDGSALWLRYASGAKAEITSKKQSPTLRIAVSELQNFWQGGIPVTLEVRNNKELRALGNEGYTIQTSKGGNQITIASSGEQGVLYGTYHLLRLQATGQLPESALQSLNISERICHFGNFHSQSLRFDDRNIFLWSLAGFLLEHIPEVVG